MMYTKAFLHEAAAVAGVVFTIGKYRFHWKKAPSGIGILTTEHPGFTMPFHQVCGEGNIRNLADQTAKDFEAGKTPREGVFRRTELPVMHKGAAGGVPMRKAISPYSTWATQAHDEGIFLDGPDGPELPEEWRRPGKVVVGPPPCPNRPEHPYVGSVVYQGMLILVENEKGSVREGPPGDNGKPTWRTRMCCHYGEFADTIGTDGDPIDVFVGSDATAPMAYVVHQKIPGTEKHDEDKVMVGFRTAEDAEEMYRRHYDKGGFFGGLTPWPVAELRAYLQSGEADGNRLDSPSRVRGLMKGEIANAPGLHLDAVKHRWIRDTDIKAGAVLPSHMGDMKITHMDDTHVHIRPDSGGSTVQVPRASAHHFFNDVNGTLAGHTPTSPSKDVNEAIRTNNRIGKGNDGTVYHGTPGKIVKVSTTVPYQPFNDGHRTPEGAARHLHREAVAHEALAGIPGVPKIEAHQHEGRTWLVKPYLAPIGEMSKDEAEHVRSSIHAMHARGWSLGDQVQLGRDEHGTPHFMDLGQAHQTRERSAIDSDEDRIRTMLQDHGHEYLPTGERLGRVEKVLRGMVHSSVDRGAPADHVRKRHQDWKRLADARAQELSADDSDAGFQAWMGHQDHMDATDKKVAEHLGSRGQAMAKGTTRPRMTMNLHALLQLLQKARRIDPNQMGLFGFGGSVAPALAEPKKVQVEEHQRTVDGKTVQVPTHERVVPPRPPDPEAPRKKATWYAHSRINKLKSSISTVQTPEHLHGMHKKLDTLHAYATKWGMGPETHDRLAQTRSVLHAHAATQKIEPKAPPPRVPPQRPEPKNQMGFLPPPGEGWMPVVGSKHGGYHKPKAGGGYAYWYPGEGETQGKAEDRQAVEPVAPVVAPAPARTSMSLSDAVKAVTSALQGYDRDITVKSVAQRYADSEIPGDHSITDGYRLLVGEKSKKGFKNLGVVDIGIDENGEIHHTSRFSTRSEVLSARVRNAMPQPVMAEEVPAPAPMEQEAAESEAPPQVEQPPVEEDTADDAAPEAPPLEDVAGDDYTKDIPTDLARRAWAGISHSPERRGDQAISDYAAHLTAAKERFEAAATTPEGKAQVAGLFKEYRDGYRKHVATWLAAQSRLMSPMITGPARFPVERMRKIGDTADARSRELQEWSSRAQARIVKTITTKPKTAEEIASAANAKQTHSFDGGQIVYNPGEERLQVLFDDKPDAEMRAKLKGAGFVFSFKNTAWQRKLTDNAVYSARRLLPGAENIPLWSTSAKAQPAANEGAAPEPAPAASPAADKTHQQYQKRIDAVKALLDKPAGMSAVDHQLALSRAMAELELEQEEMKAVRHPDMKEDATAAVDRGRDILAAYSAPVPAPAEPDNEVGDFKNAPGYHFDEAKHRWVKDEEPTPAPEIQPEPVEQDTAAPEAPAEILEPVQEVEEPEDAPASDAERKGPGSRRQHVDVGEKIGGARKDKWERVDRHNLGALEAEGDAAAFKHVTKQKVLGEHDPQADRDAGNTAGCSMMKAALYSAIASKPNIPAAEDLGQILRDMMGYGFIGAAKDVSALVDAMTPEKWRAAYVSACSKIEKGLDECSTWENVYSFLGELREPLDKGGAYSQQVPITKEVAADLTRRFPARPGNWTSFRSREDGADHRIDPSQLTNAGLQVVSKRSPLDHNKHDWYLRTPVKDPAERWAPAIEAMVLGKRFYDSALHIKGAFAKQSYEAKNQADDDWSWSDAATKSGGNGAKRNAFVFTRRHAEPTRKGGAAIPEAITGEMLADTFGLRAVEYGNWVNDEDAGKHLALAYGAFTDLADLVGIDPKQISHSKTLAMAFGARGSGRFNAHYEPDRKVINLTHTRGGGTLAHEWAHFLDHIVAGGGSRTVGMKREATQGSDGLATHPAVQSAFAACMRAMTDADPSTMPAKGELERAAQKLKIQKIMARTPEQREAFNKAAEDHNHKVKTQHLSKFAADAAHLGSYWSSNHEMFARCFESWAEDKLRSSGRANTYLVTGTGAYDIIKDGRAVEPYPQGAERERINASIDRLVATLRTTGALQKALGFPTLAHQIPALQRLLRSTP